MDAQEILKSLGAIAGVGGVCIGVFLLVIRMVLKSVPGPLKKNISAEHFFKTINRITLYAFVLALVGLILYGLLEINKRSKETMQKTFELTGQLAELREKHNSLSDEYTQLIGENKDLRARIDAIEEAGLKARSSGFEVLSADMTFDLTGWKQASDEDFRTKRVSEFIWTTRRQVWRAQKEATKFSATFATSSPFDPVFSCSTHVMTPIFNTDPTPPGKESLRRWILEYDVSKENLFTPFDIVTQVRAWNSFQNPVTEHEGTLILYPTRHASLQIIFPTTKLPKPNSIECSTMRLAMDESPVPIADPDLSFSADQTRLTWKIPQPRLGVHYIIQWKW